jgi:hypothetical protein
MIDCVLVIGSRGLDQIKGRVPLLIPNSGRVKPSTVTELRS